MGSEQAPDMVAKTQDSPDALGLPGGIQCLAKMVQIAENGATSGLPLSFQGVETRMKPPIPSLGLALDPKIGQGRSGIGLPQMFIKDAVHGTVQAAGIQRS